MEWIKNIEKGNSLSGKRIVITGCGFKEHKCKFTDITTGEDSSNYIYAFNNNIKKTQKLKLNIGSAIAFSLAAKGAIVHLVSTSEDKLKIIKERIVHELGIDEDMVEYSTLDLLHEKEVKNFVKSLKKDKTIHWVQSVGLGAGSYKLKDDNPYLPIEEIPLELLEKESTILLRATHLMMNEFLPIFEKQNETKIVIVSSMSAIRGYSFGATHCAAKGALDRYANAAMLALYGRNIFLSTIRPGAIDTGMYDSKVVQSAILNAAEEYNCSWRKNGIRFAPPISVGNAVKFIFETNAQIPSLNLVSKGQFPNEGS